MAGVTRRTVVAVHAHPDDEALLSAGTLASLASAGHRVVLVLATRGEVGAVGDDVLAGDEHLGARREAEARASADAIGAARLVFLDYLDSGSDLAADRWAPGSLCAAPLDEVADRLAAVLVEESADLLVADDRNGGYGHPDHVQVHRVGVAAAALAGTPVVLEATADRDRLLRWTRPLRWVLPLDDWRRAYTPGARITHRVDVRRYARVKRAAMAAHASQASGGLRTLAVLRRLPLPLFRLAFGVECYVRRN